MMKISFFTLIIIVSIFLIGCVHKKPTAMLRINDSTLNIKDIQNGKIIDSTLIVVDTTRILGKNYLVMYRTNDTLTILRENDIIYSNNFSIRGGIEFNYFNEDRYKDLIITHLTNMGGVIDVMVFDSSDLSFKLINDLEEYPSPTHLINNYYYSYHRAGCADMNWVSDLFEIKNYKTVFLAEIYGQGCDSNPKKIDIFKIENNDKDSKILVTTLSIDTINNYPENKWGFIKDYWTKKYVDFIK